MPGPGRQTVIKYCKCGAKYFAKDVAEKVAKHVAQPTMLSPRSLSGLRLEINDWLQQFDDGTHAWSYGRSEADRQLYAELQGALANIPTHLSTQEYRLLESVHIYTTKDRGTLDGGDFMPCCLLPLNLIFD